MKYRPEIDGLRAIAVLPVILFHAGFSIFSGGYIGVDIFFVISGYLITSIILQEKDNGTFTIRNFYIRRARRILPALLFIMLVCIPFAWLWLLPKQFENFSESLVAVIAFSSNILFWSENGYFAEISENKPLLHTWSLAVEEQYYILFPPIIIGLWRFGKTNIAIIIALAALISFGWCEYASRHFPEANFFLLPSRMWELLAGSLTAFTLHNRTLKPSNLLSGIGLILIIASIFIYDSTTRWPSIHTLAPIIGTALIILFTAPQTFVYKILSIRAIVGIGLISYSAYLWHHPIFAFARIRIDAPVPEILMAALAIISLILAWGTWKYIETPFRKKKSAKIFQPRQAIIMASTLSIFFISFGLIGDKTDGIPTRISPETMKILLAKEDENPFRKDCHFDKDFPTSPKEECWLNAALDKSTIILGDSHADALAYELSKSLEPLGLNLLEHTYSSCIPISGLRRLDKNGDWKCSEYNQASFEWLKNTPEIKTVILHGRWTLYAEGTQFDNTMGGIENRVGGATDIIGAKQNKQESSEQKAKRKERIFAYEKTHILNLIALGKNVVIIHPVPEAGWRVPEKFSRKSFMDKHTKKLATSFKVFHTRNDDAIAALDIIDHPNLYHFYPHKTFCNEQTDECINADENGVYYRDDDHLSNAGVRLISGKIAKIIAEAARL